MKAQAGEVVLQVCVASGAKGAFQGAEIITGEQLAQALHQAGLLPWSGKSVAANAPAKVAAGV